MASKGNGPKMTEYSPEHRGLNSVKVIVAFSLAIGVVMISGLLQSWSVGSFVAAFVVISIVAGVFWWLFASPGAKPFSAGRTRARAMFWSKDNFDEVTKGR